ncbi:MAG: glycosyltransferase family 9 protein [Planctomycetes bacterium]|nr:glycosyltransferase family 9 protein [Planctomycetota bacterium]
MSKSPRRILLVRLSHLGDVVHALPVFHALRAAHPEAAVAWAVQKEFAGLLRGLPGLARVIEFDRRGGLRAWNALRRELAAFDPDWAVDAQGNLKSAVATRISGAPIRTGLARSDWRERAGAWLVTEHADPARGPHAIERMQALVLRVAGPRTGLRFDPALTADELAREAAEEPRALDDAEVLVHLATPGDVRSWPAERFVELGRALAERGTRAVFVSGPAEVELGRALAGELANAPGLAHWIGQRGLRRSRGRSRSPRGAEPRSWAATRARCTSRGRADCGSRAFRGRRTRRARGRGLRPGATHAVTSSCARARSPRARRASRAAARTPKARCACAASRPRTCSRRSRCCASGREARGRTPLEPRRAPEPSRLEARDGQRYCGRAVFESSRTWSATSR